MMVFGSFPAGSSVWFCALHITNPKQSCSIQTTDIFSNWIGQVGGLLSQALKVVSNQTSQCIATLCLGLLKALLQLKKRILEEPNGVFR